MIIAALCITELQMFAIKDAYADLIAPLPLDHICVTYLQCMKAYLHGETEYGWYLCLDGEKMIGGLGVIENDFHSRRDLAPNICAVYTEEEYRGRGIAGRLLTMAVEDLKSKGITPVYLLTDHTGFYERYGWQFLCMVQENGETGLSRMYIHR